LVKTKRIANPEITASPKENIHRDAIRTTALGIFLPGVLSSSLVAEFFSSLLYPLNHISAMKLKSNTF
jgi:hypothetical protein